MMNVLHGLMYHHKVPKLHSEAHQPQRETNADTTRRDSDEAVAVLIASVGGKVS